MPKPAPDSGFKPIEFTPHVDPGFRPIEWSPPAHLEHVHLPDVIPPAQVAPVTEPTKPAPGKKEI